MNPVRGPYANRAGPVDAPGERKLPESFHVRLVEFEASGWAIIARDGERFGCVPVEALVKMQ